MRYTASCDDGATRDTPVLFPCSSAVKLVSDGTKASLVTDWRARRATCYPFAAAVMNNRQVLTGMTNERVSEVGRQGHVCFVKCPMALLVLRNDGTLMDNPLITYRCVGQTKTARNGFSGFLVGSLGLVFFFLSAAHSCHSPLEGQQPASIVPAPFND